MIKFVCIVVYVGMLCTGVHDAFFIGDLDLLGLFPFALGAIGLTVT